MSENNKERIIKKYQNRRLYDTATSTYIVLEDIKQIVIAGDNVKVVDNKTEEDVTRSVLLQIILEEEINATPIFSNTFLVQIIRFYGKSFQTAISPFLEQGVEMLKQTQRKFYSQLKSSAYKNTLPSGFDLWKEFLNEQGPQVQHNIFNYLTNTTSNFIQMQGRMQEELQSQAKNIFDTMLKFPFGDDKGKK